MIEHRYSIPAQQVGSLAKFTAMRPGSDNEALRKFCVNFLDPNFIELRDNHAVCSVVAATRTATGTSANC